MEARLDGSRVMEVVIPFSWCDGISSWEGGSIMSSSKPIGDLTVRPEKRCKAQMMQWCRR